MGSEAVGRPGTGRSWCVASVVVLAMGCAWVVWHSIGSYRRSQQEMGQAVCFSNLKQIGLAMHLYAEDHAAGLPPSARWVELTKPYMHLGGNYTCPAAPKLPVGYAYADYLAGHDPVKEPYAAEVLMLWDGKPGSPDPEWRHNGCANAGYLDGHVKLAYPGSVFAQAIEFHKTLVEGQLPPPPSRDVLGRPSAAKVVHRDRASTRERPSP